MQGYAERNVVYKFSQDTYGWGDHKEFCSSCTFNALGLFASALGNREWWWRVAREPDLLQNICIQGSMAMPTLGENGAVSRRAFCKPGRRSCLVFPGRNIYPPGLGPLVAFFPDLPLGESGHGRFAPTPFKSGGFDEELFRRHPWLHSECWRGRRGGAQNISHRLYQRVRLPRRHAPPGC